MNKNLRTILIVGLSFAPVTILSACFTDSSPPPATVVTQPLKTVCLPMVPYSAADQSTFADEAEALKQTGKFPQTLRFLGDYKAMRDADRACTGK